MERIFKITSKNLNNKYILEKTITLKLTEEKFEEIKEIVIEVDDIIEEVLKCIVDNDLLDRMDDKDFRQLVVDAYYSEIFNE